MKQWLHKPIVGWLILPGLMYSVWYFVAVNRDVSTPAPQTVFHNSNPTAGVTVPLHIHNGLILFTALINGTNTSCMLDTGNNTMLLGDSDAIVGRSLNRQLLMMDGMGRTKTYEQRLIKSIRLGDFEVCNVPGWRSVRKPIEKAPMKSSLPILLGNSFFKDTILTIDYRAQTLLILPAATNIANREKYPPDYTLNFTLDAVSSPDGWGVPTVEGMIERRKIHCIIDTGWSIPEMGVSATIFAGIDPKLKRVSVKRDFVFGSRTTDAIQNVHGKVGDLEIITPILQTEVLGMEKHASSKFESDALIGTSLLIGFRLTIDYGARRIYLYKYR